MDSQRPFGDCALTQRSTLKCELLAVGWWAGRWASWVSWWTKHWPSSLPFYLPRAPAASQDCRRWGKRSGGWGRERAGLRQQPFPGELLTEVIISGSSSQAGNEGGLISERLPLHHFHLPTFRLLPPVLPPTSPLRRSTMAPAGDTAAGPQGARKEVCVQGSQGVWVCVHCTRMAHVPPDMLMRQCTHAIRCAHIGICVLACTHTHTATPRIQRHVCLPPNRLAW